MPGRRGRQPRRRRAARPSARAPAGTAAPVRADDRQADPGRRRAWPAARPTPAPRCAWPRAPRASTTTRCCSRSPRASAPTCPRRCAPGGRWRPARASGSSRSAPRRPTASRSCPSHAAAVDRRRLPRGRPPRPRRATPRGSPSASRRCAPRPPTCPASCCVNDLAAGRPARCARRSPTRWRRCGPRAPTTRSSAARGRPSLGLFDDPTRRARRRRDARRPRSRGPSRSRPGAPAA